MTDPRHIDQYTRDHVMEQIMALVGRGAANSAAYRRALTKLDLTELRDILAALEADEDSRMAAQLERVTSTMTPVQLSSFKRTTGKWWLANRI
jgi:hypothetical protein